MRVKLEEVCKRIYAGGDVPKNRYSEKKTDKFAVPIYANAEKDEGLYGYTDDARENDVSITVAARGTIGYTAIRREPFLPVVRLITVVPDLSKVSERYLYFALRNCKPKSNGTSIQQLTVPDIKKNSIRLIELSEQEQIADVLDSILRIIELRKLELEKLDELIKARFVELSSIWAPQWKPEPLFAYLEDITYGFTNPMPDADEGPWKITAKDVVDGRVDFKTARKTTQEAYDSLTDKSKPQIGSVLLTKDGTLGRTAVVENENICVNQSVAVLKVNNRVLPRFLEILLRTPEYQREMLKDSGGGTIKHIYITKVDKMMIMVPSVEQQKDFLKFVAQVDKSLRKESKVVQTKEQHCAFR